MMDDGGVDVPLAGGIWRQSVARITGSPPHIHFNHVGDPKSPPPATIKQIQSDQSLWLGPLGPYYSSGLVAADHLLFATKQYNWNWGNNGRFAGLEGISYSANHGQTWRSSDKHFPAPLGNLSWVIRGRGGVYYDGYVYAIASEREFNASTLIIGRSRPDPADITDPSKWQWATGWLPNTRADVASVFELVPGSGADPVLGLAYHLSADGLRLTAASLSADVYILLCVHYAGDLGRTEPSSWSSRHRTRGGRSRSSRTSPTSDPRTATAPASRSSGSAPTATICG